MLHSAVQRFLLLWPAVTTEVLTSGRVLRVLAIFLKVNQYAVQLLEA